MPGGEVHGIFGDRMAIVIPLTRRRKKRRVVHAGDGIGTSTTSRSEGFAISRAGISVSTWKPKFAVWRAGDVAR